VRQSFFFLQHGVSVDIPVAMDLMLVCKKEVAEQVRAICRFYGIWTAEPRDIIRGSGSVSIKSNFDVLGGVTKYLGRFIQGIEPFNLNFVELQLLTAHDVAKALHLYLGRNMSNVHKLCASYAFINLLIYDNRLDMELAEVAKDESCNIFPQALKEGLTT